MDSTEIDKAIGAHGMWKARLKIAIDSGKLDTPLDTIRADNKCAFGEWLYGHSISPAAKAAPQYPRVRDLHAAFHQQAARVAEAASTGDKASALKLLALQGDYSKASAALTAAMREWKAAV
jgi:Chemoreceptor zinc-binding domain